LFQAEPTRGLPEGSGTLNFGYKAARVLLA